MSNEPLRLTLATRISNPSAARTAIPASVEGALPSEAVGTRTGASLVAEPALYQFPE